MFARVRPLIGVVGDFNPSNPTHRFTNEALALAGTDVMWVSTESVGSVPAERLTQFDGLWIAPASPYRSMDGALSAIHYARERGVPLVGT
jgi:CTP synthase (UTP-ammonia lyase)